MCQDKNPEETGEEHDEEDWTKKILSDRWK